MIKKSLIICLILAIGLVCFYYNSGYNLFTSSSSKIEIYGPDHKLKATFKLEIADSPDEHQRGLMFRQPNSFSNDQAMLFIFPDLNFRSFWMKNTYISLDIIYFDQFCKLISVQKNVPILNEIPRPSTGPAKYVLEINAGLFDKLGLALNDHCKIQQVSIR